MKRDLILLFILSILGVASLNAKAPQEADAWTSIDENDENIETSFLSEELDQNGIYHYKFHIKNVGKIYIRDLSIWGQYNPLNELDKAHATFEVKNDLFDYKTLLIAPNQELDVDFSLNQRFLDINQVSINAFGYLCNNENYFANGHLNSNILSRENSKISLTIENRDSNYTYIAILKTTVDGEDYYFSAEESSEYKVNGNYASNGDRDYLVELVKVLKQEKYNVDPMAEDKEARGSMNRDIMLLFFWPMIIPLVIILGGSILVCLIVGISVAIKIKKKKSNAN